MIPSPTSDLEATLFEAVAELGKLLGLNKSGALALALLYTAEDSLSLDEVTVQTGIAKSSNSVILKNLEQMGLVEVVDKPHDRRKYYKVTNNPGDAFARLIAQRLDNATLHRDSLLRIDDGKNHSEEYLQRLNQLKSIYKVLLHMSVYLRAIGAGAWETLDEHLLAVDTTDT
jgi:DNA-binding transcriptional regulator GbsR (MarR family)